MEQINTWLSLPKEATRGWHSIGRLAIYYDIGCPIADLQGNGHRVPIDMEQIPIICERLMNEYKFWLDKKIES